MKLLVGLGIVFWTLLIIGIFAPDIPKEKTAKKVAETPVIPLKDTIVLAEQDYLVYFQNEWNAIEPTKKGVIPKYGDCLDSLQRILDEMDALIEVHPTYAKVTALRLKFLDSDKNKSAQRNYLTYGQIDHLELGAIIEEYYKMRDVIDLSDGVNIVNYKITGQSNKGWLVLVRFIPIGKSHFYEETLDLRYSAKDKSFYVENNVHEKRLYN